MLHNGDDCVNSNAHDDNTFKKDKIGHDTVVKLHFKKQERREIPREK